MELKVGGKRVFAATGGKDFDPALPCIVFLHGAGMDHTVWALQTRYFAWHGYGVLAVDLPGHGKSDGPALTAIGDMADWVWALCDAAQVKEAALVGHSMGTIIALEAAKRAPDRVRGLGLVATGAKMPVHPELQAAADAGEHKAYDLIVDWGFGKRGRMGGNQAPGLWMAGGATRLLERGSDGALGKDFAACAAYDGALDAAAKVACPVVVIAGSDDKMTPPKAGRAVADAIAGAKFVTIDCGHMHMVEKPGETLDALRGTL
ncbi:MAG: alpha/beta hydrolase [Alphaproteobacteria bacterium]|nr:alpha/beta hydrolase [Alphaproteobacteria bacterium]